MFRKASDFFAGFVLGLLTGALVALLFAPRRGEETRALLQEKGIELRERALEKVEELQEKGKKIIEEGKEVAAQRREELLKKLGA